MNSAPAFTALMEVTKKGLRTSLDPKEHIAAIKSNNINWQADTIDAVRLIFNFQKNVKP